MKFVRRSRVLARAIHIAALAVLVATVTLPSAVGATAPHVQVHIVRHGNHHVRIDHQTSIGAAVGVPAPGGASSANTQAATPPLTEAPGAFPFQWRPELVLPPASNQRTAGTILTLRFTLGGDQGLHILADHSPRSWRIDCTTGAQIGDSDFRTIPHALRYNPANENYFYTWVTPEGWSNSCRIFSLALTDGSVHRLRFTFDPLALQAPLQHLPATNVAMAGDVIDVAFRLKHSAPGPDQVLGQGSPRTPRTRQIDCVTGRLIGPSLPSQPYGPTALTRTGDIFHYAWQTQPAYIGECRTIQLRLADGSLLVVRFHFNRPPVAKDDAYQTSEDAPLAVAAATGVLANDRDPDTAHALLRATLLSPPHHALAGSFALHPDGSFSYTPDATFQSLHAGQHRNDSFRYTVSDGHGGSDMATATIQVNGTNDPPVAVADGYATDEDVPLSVAAASGVLANDTDSDTPHSSLTAVQVTGPAHAASFMLHADGSFDYTPAANFNGTDTFSYRANDGTSNSNTVAVTLTVNAVNDPPVNTLPASLGAEKDTDTAFGGISVADPDAGSAPIAVEFTVQYGTLTVSTSVSGGVGAADVTGNGSSDVTLTGTLAAINVTLGGANGLVYRSASDYAGSSDTLGMVSNDQGHSGAGGPQTDSDSTSITIELPPVASDDGYTTSEDTPLSVNAASGVLANDTDPDTAHSALTAALVSGPSHASSFTLHANGSFDYNPNADYNGSDSFTYRTSDGFLHSNIATVSLTINPVNDAPVAAPDSYTAGEDTPISPNAAMGVLANDTDVDTAHGSLTAVQVTGPSHASSFTLHADGSFDYTPVADFNGTDSFSYKANDGSLESNTATVTITLNPVNDAPVITRPASATTDEDTPFTFNVSNTISVADVDAGVNSVQVALSVSHGTLSLSGVAGLSFSFGDANGTGAGDGTDDAAMTFRGTLSHVNAALSGLVYAPASNYNGPDSLSIAVNDLGNTGSGGALTDSKSVSLTVNPVNDAPVAADDSYSLAEDGSLSPNAATGVLANDTDIDTAHGSLTAVQVSGPSHASSFTLNADGSFDYTPAANFNGTDSFTYKANDGSLDSNTATVTITVNPVNDAPVLDNGKTPVLANEIENSGTPSGAVGTLVSDLVDTGGALDNVSDVDGDPLGIALIGVDTVQGTWFYTTDGGAHWSALGAVSNGSARLLAANPSTRLYLQSDPGFFGVISSAVTFRAWDRSSGSNGDSGVDTSSNGGTSAFSSATDTADLTILQANQAPVISVPEAQSFDEDTTLIFDGSSGTAITVSDTDASALDLTLDITTSAGTISLGSIAGLSSISGNGTDHVIATGSQATLNSDLAGTTFTPTADIHGGHTIDLTLNDNGHTGAGGAKSDAESIGLLIQSINDAPVITRPASATTNEDTPLTFSSGNSNLVSVSDVDAGAGSVQVALSVSHGTLTLASLSGLSFTTGDGTADAALTFSGTLGNLNSALDGLVYTPGSNYNGADALSIDVNDNGNTGAGGALTDFEVRHLRRHPGQRRTGRHGRHDHAAGGRLAHLRGHRLRLHGSQRHPRRQLLQGHRHDAPNCRLAEALGRPGGRR